ncbi:hypothetical protein AAG906_029148 [Vitis piasezkii]
MDDYGNALMWVTQNENVFEVEEILTNILLRLPVKSLLICNFVKSHLIQSQHNPTYVFYPYDPWHHNVLPGCDGIYFKGIICSFNGLICCVNYYSAFLHDIRRVAHTPYSSFSSNHVCINGIVYWFTRSEEGIGSILVVNREEFFSTIRLPKEKILRPYLINLEGCLCLVVDNGLEEYRFDIWALQDSKETWRKFNWEHDGEEVAICLPMPYTESLLPCNGRLDS